eukprot:4919489-Amphidinium_carterae.2
MSFPASLPTASSLLAEPCSAPSICSVGAFDRVVGIPPNCTPDEDDAVELDGGGGGLFGGVGLNSGGGALPVGGAGLAFGAGAFAELAKMLANSSRSILCLLSSNSLSVVFVLFFCLSDMSRSASRLASNTPYLTLEFHVSKKAVGSDQGSVSTLIKFVAEMPGYIQPRMRYGYHASALSLRAFENITKEGLAPGGHSEGDCSIRDSVHLCPLHPTHSDAVGIWGLNRPPKDKNKYEGYIVQVIFVVDLLMLQEEHEVGVYQARSGNDSIPSVIPWNCICMVINARGFHGPPASC